MASHNNHVSIVRTLLKSGSSVDLESGNKVRDTSGNEIYEG